MKYLWYAFFVFAILCALWTAIESGYRLFKNFLRFLGRASVKAERFYESFFVAKDQESRRAVSKLAKFVLAGVILATCFLGCLWQRAEYHEVKGRTIEEKSIHAYKAFWPRLPKTFAKQIEGRDYKDPESLVVMRRLLWPNIVGTLLALVLLHSTTWKRLNTSE